MKPVDLGLPEKFSRWRSLGKLRTQYDAILEVACSDKRFNILNAPTGVGKSPIVMGLATILGGRGIILTGTKDLQHQYMEDFRPMGLVEVKGQSNYPCLFRDPDGNLHDYMPQASGPLPFSGGKRLRMVGCDEGPCHAGVACSAKERGCHYYDAVRSLAKSSMGVTNYSYWMHMQKYAEVSTLGVFDTLILDEAHLAASRLADFVKIVIDRKKVGHLLHETTPKYATLQEWVEWAGPVLAHCEVRLENAKNVVSMSSRAVSVVRDLKDLHSNLSDLVMAGKWQRSDVDPVSWVPGQSTDWIIEEDRKEATFQPIWASAYAERYLFAGVKKVVLVSATVTKRDARYLGLKEGDYSYQEFPSPFKPENRPLYIVPSAKVSRHMSTGERRTWMNRIDSIIDKECIELKGKGIIHARSYERAKMIYAASKFKHLLMIHDSRSTRDTVARFKESKEPCVLISPAVSTGYDFPMDQCRFQIIAKIPFIDTRPKVVQARHRADRGYTDYEALVELIQMVGRGVRSSQDSCRTYLVDDNWSMWFYPRNKRWIPKWFNMAVRRIHSIHDVKVFPRHRRGLGV